LAICDTLEGEYMEELQSKLNDVLGRITLIQERL